MVVIPKENAVFWMDGRGRWCNRHGRFEQKKIIDYFNTAIDKDDGGFFVCHEKEGRIEKVYFHCEDTALFVTDIRTGTPAILILNTGSQVTLQYGNLYIKNDSLFANCDDNCIKFTERCLLKMSRWMEYEGDTCYIREGQKRYCIPDRTIGTE